MPDAKIVFDFDDPMGHSTCVACGECVQACPTGALMPAAYLDAHETRVAWPDRKVDSLCPYCGVGCQVTYEVKDEKVVYATGRDGPANHNRLCVKGRFGFDYIHHPHRLTRPLVRLPNVPKHAQDQVDPANPWTHFREATWEEALDRAAAGLGAHPGQRRGRRGWPGSVRPRVRTRKPICSRSWCGPGSAPTTSIIARGCATHRRWRR